MSLIAVIGASIGLGVAELISISVALSMDAFAVSISKGLCQKKMNWKNAAIVGLYFGFFQAIFPLLGYYLGSTFSSFVNAYSSWIAFAILFIIALNMIIGSVKNKNDEDNLCSDSGEMSLHFKEMIFLSIATSIDAFAVGVSFAFLNANMAVASISIGITAFTLSTIGVYIGFKFGSKFKSKSEILGGLILIIIAFRYLIDAIN
ncbi:manganese efflux pump MntP [Peptostreptococcus faecalis]|uniref:manganese efflux pump MntP n=1 Tax=Peptostreptococcus faecalis TaxID=2045015 RepID=UPI002E8E5502|nr:manganese efflux pump MntP family protein [Peptostreptococcus faecalis]